MNPTAIEPPKLNEDQLWTYYRRMRRTMRYPKMKGSANPYAHRTAVFKLRYGIT